MSPGQPQAIVALEVLAWDPRTAPAAAAAAATRPCSYTGRARRPSTIGAPLSRRTIQGQDERAPFLRRPGHRLPRRRRRTRRAHARAGLAGDLPRRPIVLA